MTEKLIDIIDLCFSYSGKEVLHEINLTVNRGDFIAVIGPNGGGKTTLLKLMLGLLKPTRGKILLQGKPVGTCHTEIGYVPQQIDHSISFPATARDIVLMGKHGPKRRFRFKNSPKDHSDALQALDQMGIGDYADSRITDLSGGQRQRVLIARALVTQPEILVMDEPTASLDTKGQLDFYQLLTQLNDHLTIFIVSHDLMTIYSYAKSIACVNKRLHYHQKFDSSDALLSAFYSCSVDDSCPVDALPQFAAEKNHSQGDDNA